MQFDSRSALEAEIDVCSTRVRELQERVRQSDGGVTLEQVADQVKQLVVLRKELQVWKAKDDAAEEAPAVPVDAGNQASPTNSSSNGKKKKKKAKKTAAAPATAADSSEKADESPEGSDDAKDNATGAGSDNQADDDSNGAWSFAHTLVRPRALLLQWLIVAFLVAWRQRRARAAACSNALLFLKRG